MKQFIFPFLLSICFYSISCNNKVDYYNRENIVKYFKEKATQNFKVQTILCEELFFQKDKEGQNNNRILISYFDKEMKDCELLKCRLHNLGENHCHLIEFYKNGKLRSYEYVVREEHDTNFVSYDVKFDTLGNINSSYGTPLTEVLKYGTDSLILCFSTFFYDNIECSFSFDDITFHDLQLFDSKILFPLVLEARIKATKKDKIHFRITCFSSNSKEPKIYIDSIHHSINKQNKNRNNMTNNVNP